ncbi:MAG: hypothetical protein AB7G28_14780 [Pirellulales bacterium]
METNPNKLRLRALIAFQDKRFADALVDLDILVSLTGHDWDHRWRGLAFLCAGKYAEAYEVFETLHDRCPEDPRTLTVMSVIKSSCADDSVRDGRMGLEFAELQAQTFGYDWSTWAVLAAAHAEIGEFEIAVRHIDDAIRTAPASQVERFSCRRQQYLNKEAYRLPADGFDGLVPMAKCLDCGADAFCSDGYPAPGRNLLCLKCAQTKFATDLPSN